MTEERFKPTGRGNLLLKGVDFAISFRGDTTNIMPEAPFVNALFAGNDKGTGETALITKEGMFILNGDFRGEYLEVFDKGLEACKEVYERNKMKHRSTWSED